MADDRSLWALRLTVQGRRRAEDSPEADPAVTEARRALEWMRLRLEHLREERNANQRGGTPGDRRSRDPR